MHEIMNKKFYLGPKFGTLFNKKWITISELLHRSLAVIHTSKIDAQGGNNVGSRSAAIIRSMDLGFPQRVEKGELGGSPQ
jgi:hypothetical protein